MNKLRRKKAFLISVLLTALFVVMSSNSVFAMPMDMSGMQHMNMTGCEDNCDKSLEEREQRANKHCALCFEQQDQNEDKAAFFTTKKFTKHHAVLHNHKTGHQNHRWGRIGHSINLHSLLDFLRSVHKRE